MIREWWGGLDTSQRSWFTITGLVTLTVVSMVIGIVACTNVALLPLMIVGFSVMLTSALVLFTVAMVRFT